MRIILLILPMIIGFILDCIFGDPYSAPHPVRFIGTMISRLEKLLRSHIKDEAKAGTLLLIIVLAVSALVPQLIILCCYYINVFLGSAAEGIFFYYLIAAKCLKTESMKVYHALSKGKTEKARKAVSMIVGRDTESLDETGIIKAAVETVAENTSDGVTAPMIYMMIGGVSLGFFYKAANTMDSMIGYKNERYIKFGKTAARLDDFLNYIPSRLTAAVMIISAFLMKMDGKKAYQIWKRDRLNHSSPNSAQTESVCAGALNVMLGGDAYYFGKLCKKKTIGDAIRKPDKEDIIRANKLMYCTVVIMLMLCMGGRAFLWGVLFC